MTGKDLSNTPTVQVSVRLWDANRGSGHPFRRVEIYWSGCLARDSSLVFLGWFTSPAWLVIGRTPNLATRAKRESPRHVRPQLDRFAEVAAGDRADLVCSFTCPKAMNYVRPGNRVRHRITISKADSQKAENRAFSG